MNVPSIPFLQGKYALRQYRLDALMGKTKKELEILFLSGQTPSIEEIKGPTRGKVLSGIAHLQHPMGVYLTNVPFLPWKGKQFETISPTEGRGINLVELWPTKQTMFHFETAIVKSLIDGDNDVFSLNYDLPGNPWFIRKIRDDLKKIDEGLFLGTANFRTKSGYRLALYFALETEQR
jgi:hypothetical protein